MIKQYRNFRNLLNQQIVMYEGSGEFDIPIVPAYHGDIPDKWIGFNYAMQCKHPENTGVHFFLDDYQFERMWNDPNTNIEYLKKFQCALTPDWSLYMDMPMAMKI